MQQTRCAGLSQHHQCFRDQGQGGAMKLDLGSQSSVREPSHYPTVMGLFGLQPLRTWPPSASRDEGRCSMLLPVARCILNPSRTQSTRSKAR